MDRCPGRTIDFEERLEFAERDLWPWEERTRRPSKAQRLSICSSCFTRWVSWRHVRKSFLVYGGWGEAHVF